MAKRKPIKRCKVCGAEKDTPPRKTRRAFRSSRWLCPQGLHGVPLAATRRNILRGTCVLP